MWSYFLFGSFALILSVHLIDVVGSFSDGSLSAIPPPRLQIEHAPPLDCPLKLACYLATLVSQTKTKDDAKTTAERYQSVLDWFQKNASLQPELGAHVARWARMGYIPDPSLNIIDAIYVAALYARQFRVKLDKELLSLSVLVLAAGGECASDYTSLLTVQHYSTARTLDTTLPEYQPKKSTSMCDTSWEEFTAVCSAHSFNLRPWHKKTVAISVYQI